ncbi:WD40 repeat-like protein [Basidiobolus meristosporus CBS 931.73]|uniref:WD40 repeat-like protein n=1 Tax=Basidiobolus meristosporus CBS 931.73 TaxID=1314790 RepID=A0A1Y1XUL8_9FUNG|nr:WD40 repeat-like protein [Basidiobolus meristosporus CBS 931.73]|eukprot:ORX89451.1 WD40 repeat-like protein [Basidiobolus meristosporus CBS 931.73]
MNQFILSRELGLDSPQVLRTFHLLKQVHSIELSHNIEVNKKHFGTVNCLDIETVEGRYLLSGGTDRAIYIYDLETPPNAHGKIKISSIANIPRQASHGYGISGIRWYPFDTGIFTTSSFDKTVKVWDTNSLTEVCGFELNGKVYSHDMSSIGSHCLIAAAASEPFIRLCDLRSGAFTHSLTGHKGSVITARWSPRDEYLLASGGADHTIRIWDIRKARACLMQLDQHNADPLSGTNVAHSGLVNGLTFTQDGMYLLSTGHDEKMRLWNMSTGENSLTNYGPRIRNKSRSCVLPMIVPSDTCWPPVVFHPSDDHRIFMFNLFDGDLIKEMTGHYGRVACAAWRMNSEEFYSGGSDHEILAWSPFTSEVVETKRSKEVDTWSDDDDTE